MHGLGLARYVFECLDLLSHVGKLEMGFATSTSLLHGVKLDLKVLKLDSKVGVLVIEVAIAVDLVGEPPIVVDEEGIVEELEVSRGAHHEEAEPCWDGECRFCFTFVIILIVGLCMEVNDMWL